MRFPSAILHVCTGKHLSRLPKLEHDPEPESETGEDDDVCFERVAAETDGERLKRMRDVTGLDDLDALRDDDNDIVLPTDPGAAIAGPSGTGVIQDAGNKGGAGELFPVSDKDSPPQGPISSPLFPLSSSSTVCLPLLHSSCTDTLSCNVQAAAGTP